MELLLMDGRNSLAYTLFRDTWRKDVEPIKIEDAINRDASGKLRIVSVSKVSLSFHPNFSAKWRRYLYIFPLDAPELFCQINKDRKNFIFDENHKKQSNGPLNSENNEDLVLSEDDELQIKEARNVDRLEVVEKPTDFSVSKVDQLSQQLEGKLLSYKMFARYTKAARNEGPPTECFMYHARPAEIRLSCSVGVRFHSHVRCHFFTSHSITPMPLVELRTMWKEEG